MATESQKDKGTQENRYLVSLSPAGQLTMPARFRKAAQEKGIRRFVFEVIDPQAGIYQLRPSLTLTQIAQTYALDLGGKLREAFDEESSGENEE